MIELTLLYWALVHRLYENFTFNSPFSELTSSLCQLIKIYYHWINVSLLGSFILAGKFWKQQRITEWRCIFIWYTYALTENPQKFGGIVRHYALKIVWFRNHAWPQSHHLKALMVLQLFFFLQHVYIAFSLSICLSIYIYSIFHIFHSTIFKIKI